MFEMQSMTEASPSIASGASRGGEETPLLPSRDELRDWLREAAQWPAGSELIDAAPVRVWVGRDRRVTFELRIGLRTGCSERYGLLQGGIGADSVEPDASTPGVSSDGWITGLQLHSERLNVWCRSPDLDRSLPGIASVWSGVARDVGATEIAPGIGDGVAQFVGKVYSTGGDRVPSSDTEVRLVGYRTGKRCVMRIRSQSDGDGQGIYVKHFRRWPRVDFAARWDELSTQLDALTRGRVRLPRLIAADPDAHIVAFGEIPHDACPVDCTNSAADVIPALCAIHRISSTLNLAIHSVSDELDTVSRWEPGLASVQAKGELCRTFERLVHKLRLLSAEIADDDFVVVHRDFHAAQLLRTDSALWIVDWDTVTLGHAEVDLATFFAHLVLERVRSGNVCSNLGAIEQGVSTYRSHEGTVNGKRLRYYVSAALSRLGALHHARGLSESHLVSMWSTAEAILDDRWPADETD